jgi:hypothetical protein
VRERRGGIPRAEKAVKGPPPSTISLSLSYFSFLCPSLYSYKRGKRTHLHYIHTYTATHIAKMKFSNALVWATIVVGMGAEAKLFGKDKREL